MAQTNLTRQERSREKKQRLQALQQDPLFCKGKRCVYAFTAVWAFFFYGFYLFKVLYGGLLFEGYTSVRDLLYYAVRNGDLPLHLLLMAAAAGVICLAVRGYGAAVAMLPVYGVVRVVSLIYLYAVKSNGIPYGILNLLTPLIHAVVALVIILQGLLLILPAPRYYFSSLRQMRVDMRTSQPECEHTKTENDPAKGAEK